MLYVIIIDNCLFAKIKLWPWRSKLFDLESRKNRVTEGEGTRWLSIVGRNYWHFPVRNGCPSRCIERRKGACSIGNLKGGCEVAFTRRMRSPDSIYTLWTRVSGSSHTSCGMAALRPFPESSFLLCCSFPVSSMKYEHVSLSHHDSTPEWTYRGDWGREGGRKGGRRGVTQINRAAKWIRQRTTGSVTRRRVSKHRGAYRQSGRCIKGRRVNGQLGSTGSTTFYLHPLFPKELPAYVAENNDDGHLVWKKVIRTLTWTFFSDGSQGSDLFRTLLEREICMCFSSVKNLRDSQFQASVRKC